MLRVSRLTDYALVLLTRLAQANGAAQSAQELASQTHLQLPMTSKALKKLSQGGWVSSQRGSQGGYYLNQPAASVRLVDVVEFFEGPIALAQCQNGSGQCDIQNHCQLRPHWQLINARLRTELSRLTLAELSRPLPLKQLAS